MTVEVRFSADTTDQLQDQMAKFLDRLNPADKTQVATAATQGNKPPKRSRKTPTKPEPPQDEPTKPELTYAGDVKPVLVKLANSRDQGKSKAANIVRSFGVSKGDQIPEDKLQEALDKALAALAEGDDE